MIERYCDELAGAIAREASADWTQQVDVLTRERLLHSPHGDQARWLAAVQSLPDVTAHVDVCADTIALSTDEPIDASQRQALAQGLRGLMPWRKGPFSFFDTHIDTEWRSDWKWQRVLPHLSALEGRAVLDVGCGSGYHCWRLYGAGARFVLGIDPTILFLMQYLAVKRYLPQAPVWFAPLRLEELPAPAGLFDTILSMGVLYHRRSPLDHLQELFSLLRPGGELVLETLVVEGDANTVLVPHDRYAMMRNVFFLPSTALLEIWLARMGFVDIRTVDESVTSTDEQHSTDWMRFQSLPDFLDPHDSTRTLEGYPAPRRAVLVATRPG